MIFIDTSALIALFVRTDLNHRAAVTAWASLRRDRSRTLTTDFVIVETVNLLRRRVGFAAAKSAGSRLVAGGFAEKAQIEPETLGHAWSLFETYDDQDFSFTDCISFAVMRERGVRRAFAYDEDFTIAGFSLL